MSKTPSEEIREALYNRRLIVLLEQDDGKFHQVGLTEAQFKQVGNTIINERRSNEDLKPGYEEVDIRLNPNWELHADYFLGLASFYSVEEMQSKE